MHHVPALPHDFSEGVPNLMSAGGFEIAWTEYMALTIEKLNALTAGKATPSRDILCFITSQDVEMMLLRGP